MSGQVILGKLNDLNEYQHDGLTILKLEAAITDDLGDAAYRNIEYMIRK